jgi:hypothetical protein
VKFCCATKDAKLSSAHEGVSGSLMAWPSDHVLSGEICKDAGLALSLKAKLGQSRDKEMDHCKRGMIVYSRRRHYCCSRSI